MREKKDGDKTVFACSACGVKQEVKLAKITEKTHSIKNVEAVGADVANTLPKTEAECPKCGKGDAYFRSEQTRAADEPETLFFTCVKCAKTWREYE